MANEPKTYYAKKETKWFLTIYMFLWTGVCLAIMLTIIYGVITTPRRTGPFVFVLIILALAALIAINYLCWQLRGREILALTDTYILLKKEGTIFKGKTRINFFDFESLEFDEGTDEVPWWIRFWGIGGGKIVINYLGRKIRFGQDLSLQEAKRLTAEIKIELEKRMENSKFTLTTQP